MTKRIVEVFSAGCPICDEVVRVVTELACENCDVGVHDMRARAGQLKGREYGINRLPAVVVNGKIADCCGQSAVDIAVLRSLGVGSAA